MISDIRLLLASDVDETLLASHQSLEGELLTVICELLKSGQVRLAIITGNDYERLQRKRVVEPIPAELRENLIVYGDGCTRKLTYTSDGEEVKDLDYHGKVEFERDDKKTIKDILASKIREWGESYPTPYEPDVEINLRDHIIHVSIGPINVSEDRLEARRDEFQNRIIGILERECDNVQAFPYDKLWIKLRGEVRNGNRASAKLEQVIKSAIEELLEGDFPRLSRPSIIERGEQLVIKPIKRGLRRALVSEIEGEVSGDNRQTAGEYGVLIGGRSTIDIQKKGVDKALAIRDLMNTLSYRGEILYFGDAFRGAGNDRPVAYVEGVHCISFGEVEEIPESVIGIGGGPFVARIYLQAILWTLTGVF